MASVVTIAPPVETETVVPAKPIAGAPTSAASVRVHVVPPRPKVNMGRAATVPEGVNWVTMVALIVFHAGALAALFFFSWQRFAVAVVLYVLAINVGIGMCYHRLLTHRGYRVPKWLEYVMTVCATLSLEGGPIFWVSTHRVHHQLSDHEGDPHTPKEGGWWAHAGWLLFGKSMHAQIEALARYSPDLRKDKFHCWLSKWHWLPITLSGVVLLAGGWIFGGLDERHRHGALGRAAARHHRPARDVAGELGHPHVGQPAFPDQGRVAQQLLGGAADRRRRMAQ